MKPWFERELAEADIIKFPEPEAKVVQMPNVQEYPDFITGVQDLQSKQKDGTISQESYDKLYTELIHRFMKKESFETPWFIREANLSRVSTGSRTLYINNINKLLKKNTPFPIGRQKKKLKGTFVPDPGQEIKDFSDTLTGKLNGEEVEIAATSLFKSADIRGGQTLKTGEAKKLWNTGYVSEGLFGMGLFLALLLDRPLSDIDIKDGVKKFLKTNGGTVTKVNPKTKDSVSLKIYLPEVDWDGLINPKTYEHPDIIGHSKSIADYTNSSADWKEIDNSFVKNQKIDNIEVIADGTSAQKATKVDVYIKYANGKRMKFERSIKSGKVKQFGQGPVGGALGQREKKYGEKGTSHHSWYPGKGSREARWSYQEDFWNNMGVNISNAENDFMGYKSDITDKLNKKAKWTKKDKDIAIDIEREIHYFPYQVATKELNDKLKGNKDEYKTLIHINGALQDYAGAKMIHIYSGGYRVMDFKKLDKLVGALDLKAFFKDTGMYPKVIIGDDDTPAGEFISVTLKTDQGKASNQVDMGELIKKVTTVEKRDY